MSDRPAVVDIRGLHFRYDGPLVLEDVNLQVAEGDFVGLVGPNGGGKTTLLRLILGFERPTSGSVEVFGMPPAAARSLVGYVPQQATFDMDFPISVMDVVLMGRLGVGRGVGHFGRNDRRAAEEAMREVGVWDLRHRRIGTLSGGQRQRALIARALVAGPRLLLLDEPTASLDMHSEQEVYELLRALNRRATIILVSHDIGFVTAYVSRVACVNRRLVVHPTEAITSEAIEAVYAGPMRFVRHDHACLLGEEEG